MKLTKLTTYDKGLMHAARIALDELPAPQKPLNYERLVDAMVRVDEEHELIRQLYDENERLQWIVLWMAPIGVICAVAAIVGWLR